MEQEQEYTLEQIIEQSFDFSDYSEEEKNEVIAETSGMIMEASLLRSLDEAGKEMQDKFNDFIESEPDEEAMSAFIGENLPNFPEVIVDEIKIFQDMGKEETNEEKESE